MDIFWVLIIVVGIFHVPLLVDLINVISPNRLKRTVANSFCYLLRLLIFSLTNLVFYLYWDFWLWLYADSLWQPHALCMSAAALWLWMGANFHYTSACWLHPGMVPSSPESPPCPRCSLPKPSNTRHCSTCDMCIHFMDHHCPFTGNCCGADSFVHFYLWLLYTEIGLVYASLVSTGPFFSCVLGFGGFWASSWLGIAADRCETMGGTHPWLFIPMLSMALLMGGILVLEVFLLLINRSTLSWCASICGKSADDFLRSDLVYPPTYGSASKTNFLLTRGRSWLVVIFHPLFRHRGTVYQWFPSSPRPLVVISTDQPQKEKVQ